MHVSDWRRDVIWWTVYPLGFTGAPTHLDEQAPVAHRLPRLENWLDYLIDLGCNGLVLGPIFRSESHGYDTLDYFAIDPRLGDDADFDALVAACHARGIKLVLDGVFNHVSARYPALRQALAEGPEGPLADMFHIDFSTTPPTRLNFEGSDDLVRLNHASPQVRKLVTDVMLHWCGRGVDGWRLDAAYAVDPEFWAPVLATVRERFPELYIYGEVIHGDYAQIVHGSGMDAVTEYELWKACWSSLATENFYELEWTLGRHNEMLDDFRPFTFIGNHDVTRIATKVGADKAILAAVLLGTVGGTPCVYYGDEQAFRGEKYDRPGGDAEVRQPMPERPDQLAGFGLPTYRAYQAILAIRRRYAWLPDARTEVESITNPRIVYRAHDPADADHWVRVTLDVTDTPTASVVDNSGELFHWPHRGGRRGV
ncbi:alpha-amylase family protein [Propionibacterium freudenreichii]|uniref:alpha-amylase family protein n=1 Tax=Propionibacterium freudenreichii TaxID=1744 RepID=UPI0006DC4281